MYLKMSDSNTLSAEFRPRSAAVQRKLGKFVASVLSYFCKLNTFFLSVFSGKPVFFVLDKKLVHDICHTFFAFMVPSQIQRPAAARASVQSSVLAGSPIRVSPHSAEVYRG